MQTVDQRFYQSLFSDPYRTTPTVMDEMRSSLGSENQAIARGAQMVSEFHGPYNGTSPVMHSFLEKRTNTIQNIGKNQKQFDKISVDILNLIRRITDNLEKIPTIISNKKRLIEELENLINNLSELYIILTDDKNKSAIEELISLYPYRIQIYKKSIKQIETCLELDYNLKDKIIRSSSSNPTEIYNQEKYFIFNNELVIDYVTELMELNVANSYLDKMKKQENTYKNLLAGSESGLAELTDKIANTESVIGRINETSSALFDTPLLREFVMQSQNLHPAINSIIMQNIQKFPYFQQISEKVGTFYTITSTLNCIDPMMWTKNDPHDFKTNNILRGSVQPKLFGPISNLITNSDGYLNTMMLRTMADNQMGKVVPDYSKKEPIAHGFSNSMDVFHTQRALNAKAEILPKLVGKLKDRLRLLDSYFPVIQAVKSSNNYFVVPVEKTEQMVNVFNRPADKPEMTVDRALAAKPEKFIGGRDNENIS